MISYVMPRGTGIIFRHNDAVPVSVWVGRYRLVAEFDEVELAQAVCRDLNRSLAKRIRKQVRR